MPRLRLALRGRRDRVCSSGGQRDGLDNRVDTRNALKINVPGCRLSSARWPGRAGDPIKGLLASENNASRCSLQSFWMVSFIQGAEKRSI